MKPHPDADLDAAIAWAGALAQRISGLDRATLQADWNTDEAKAFRNTLKARLDGMLRQLVELVMERLEQLKPAA